MDGRGECNSEEWRAWRVVYAGLEQLVLQWGVKRKAGDMIWIDMYWQKRRVGDGIGPEVAAYMAGNYRRVSCLHACRCSEYDGGLGALLARKCNKLLRDQCP